ncbi:MAG: hypothetical protein FWD37_00410 [Methanomassiliicoccaceae archaeon]|nr:hypothetical protein [Methanomassiliicoccaceae archaeon]
MYRIPDDGILERAIRTVVKKEGHIRSQSEMKELVMNELRKDDTDYRTSGERIRKMAIERNILRVEIEYNSRDDRSLPDVCPVCGYPMTAMDNTTLDGQDTKIGRRCTKCPYHTGLKRRTPGRYTFSKGAPTKKGMSAKDRIAMIREAEKLMKKSASMVESAVKGTEHGTRGKNCARSIKKLISSRKESDSLANIIKDIEFSDSEHPEWTQPLVSVKNSNLKDIK